MKIVTPRQYIEYLKDNPKGYWFKRKLYGWGWTPARWQGWLILLAFVAILLANGFYLAHKVSNNTQPSSYDLTLFFSIIIISIIAILAICYKTGEKPKWMWGNI